MTFGESQSELPQVIGEFLLVSRVNINFAVANFESVSLQILQCMQLCNFSADLADKTKPI